MEKTFALIEYGTEEIIHRSTRRNEIANERDTINNLGVRDRQGKTPKVYSCLFLGRVQVNAEGHLEDTLKSDIEKN